MAAQAYDTAFTAAFVSGPRGLQYLSACESGDLPCYANTIIQGVPCTKTGAAPKKASERPKHFHWCKPPTVDSVKAAEGPDGKYENMEGNMVSWFDNIEKISGTADAL